MLEILLSDDFEADQNIDALETEDSDAGGVEIQGYLPETVLSMNKLHPNSNICDGNSDASVGVGKPQRTKTRIKRSTQHHQVR